MAAAGTADSDMFSPIHGRPIRPLPKRNLRGRLSPESSKAILSPPAPPNPTPLFYLPYTYPPPPGGSNGSASGQGSHEPGDSSDEDDISNGSVSRFSSNGQIDDGHDQGLGGPNDGGYDWSENTNNKKKRKIPTPTHPGGSSAGFTTTGHSYATQYSQAAGGNSVHSTPRRYRSAGTQRSPLSTISGGSNGAMRRVKRFPGAASTGGGSYDGSVRSPGSGDTDEIPESPDKENRFERSGIGAPTSPFTFKCDSPVSANLAYTHPPPNVSGNYQRSMSTVGTQTSPNMSNSNAYPPQPKKKGAARAAARREFLQQQRLRQRQNSANGNKGEIWICEFCEYEAIFGQPPEALMRQYDIRDRRERRERKEAEGRRRRAEERLRKGKKAAGKTKKQQQQQQQQHNHQNPQPNSHHAPPPPPPPSQTDSQGTQSDHTPIPSATATPALKPHRPGKQHQHHHHVHGEGCHHDDYGNDHGTYRNGHGG